MCERVVASEREGRWHKSRGSRRGAFDIKDTYSLEKHELGTAQTCTGQCSAVEYSIQ